MNLLELMDSRLEVESTYGAGSRFSFTIEQKVIDPEPVGDIEKRIREQSVDYSRQTGFIIPDARILVVDDNEMNRFVFSGLIKELECGIDEADSGQECIKLASAEKYDIIFIDHMMPGMDGIETFHRIRSDKDSPNAGTPVVVLTANAVTGAREKYLKEGFDGFLTKPIVPEKLESLIEKLIPEERRKPGKNISTENPDLSAEEKELPEVEGIDWDYALMKIRSSQLLKKVVDSFCLTAGSELDTLKELYSGVESTHDPKSSEDYRIRVHAMKNTAAMCGALQVSALARVLEYAARDNDRQTLDAVMPVFEREWTRQRQLLSDAFSTENGSDGSEKEPVDKDRLSEQLDTLDRAMKDLDIDIADEVMEELKRYSYDEREEQLIGQLAVAVMNLDRAQTSEIVRKLTQNRE